MPSYSKDRDMNSENVNVLYQAGQVTTSVRIAWEKEGFDHVLVFVFVGERDSWCASFLKAKLCYD